MVRHACFLPQIYINALNLVCGHALKAIERRTGLVWLEIFILLASLFMQQQEGLSLCKLYIYPSKAKESIHILLKQGTKPTNMMCKYRQNFYKEENVLISKPLTQNLCNISDIYLLYTAKDCTKLQTCHGFYIRWLLISLCAHMM